MFEKFTILLRLLFTLNEEEDKLVTAVSMYGLNFS
jgi:hypothetical protein